MSMHTPTPSAADALAYGKVRKPGADAWRRAGGAVLAILCATVAAGAAQAADVIKGSQIYPPSTARLATDRVE